MLKKIIENYKDSAGKCVIDIYYWSNAETGSQLTVRRHPNVFHLKP